MSKFLDIGKCEICNRGKAKILLHHKHICVRCYNTDRKLRKTLETQFTKETLRNFKFFSRYNEIVYKVNKNRRCEI